MVVMKGKILTMLKKRQGDFVSGQSICDSLGVSRTAVWKHVNQLKEDGYRVESVPRKGYRIISSPDVLTSEEIVPLLDTDFIGRNVINHHEVESTNLTAKAAGRSGCPDGTVVTTEHQTGGRGRSGRSWISSPGEAVQMSIVLRPGTPPATAPPITQIGAAAVAVTLEAMGFAPKVKWPNDVLISGKKVCGILTEMTCELDRIDFIVIGIGINVNVKVFPKPVDEVATSLLLEGGRSLDRRKIAAEVLNRFEPLYREYLEGNGDAYLEICRRLSWLKGKEISFEKDGITVTATAGDIDEDGRLKVHFPDGRSEKLLSGEVHLGSV
jgi:BirA family biotin operon repressor/biotin-[acetyl-CoA-carboxylase] ligase